MFAVAPSAGAWIEMTKTIAFANGLESLPPRERGLKFVSSSTIVARNHVAPSAGAWIEI